MRATKTGKTVKLLGGYFRDGALRTTASLRPVNGYLELELAEIAASGVSGGQRTSQFLGAALDGIGDMAIEAQDVDALCIGDRMELMLQLVCAVDGETMWLSPRCERCSSRFDVHFNRSELPRQRAGEGFPYTSVEFRGKRARFRVPNGDDELWIQRKGSSVSARDMLARCFLSFAEDEVRPESFTDEEVEAVDLALDRVAPDVGTQLGAKCPVCGHSQIVEVDFTQLQRLSVRAMLEDIHTLALVYHWSENDILTLSRTQRLRYLDCIERSRGMYA